ncbi:putative phage abortive infection protein [Rubellimicrobium mesophilum]|uniref:putative phage abortive infection protein n=1 Tax=Rubellimicrobium mesophilum TaxID=1123067 RepID=UPI001B80180C|nr:putative phage abortive infection protein [Rubellimicrobium mesophilum]
MGQPLDRHLLRIRQRTQSQLSHGLSPAKHRSLYHDLPDEPLTGSFTIGLLIFIIWAVWPFLLGFLFPWEDINPGTSGDMFGSLTALFSGLAFAGLISTLLMQSRELQLQRDELTQTREVFSVQRFETTLFGLLRLLNDHVASIEVDSTGWVRPGASKEDSRVGRLALEVMAERLPTQFERQTERDNVTGRPKVVGQTQRTLEQIVDSYEKIYRERFEIALGPYFRLLYNIFRLIEEAKLSELEPENRAAKNEYGRIVRAQLSSSEVKLLMFNGASTYGVKFKPWIIKYSLLKHLPSLDRQNCATVCSDFPPQAFGEH